MSFADEWGSFPECGIAAAMPTKKINNADFDREFEEFCKEQRQLKAERLAKEAETKQEVEQEAEAQPTDEVAEEAYLAFVEEDEKPKSKRKKKTEAVVEETSDETPVVED